MAGSLSKFALAQGSTWLTGPTLGSGHRYPLKSSTLQYRTQIVESDDLLGTATRGSGDVGNAEASGDTVWTSDYRQHMLAAALMMGTAGTPTTVESGVYLHKFPFTADVGGLFASVGLDFVADAHQFLSVKSTRRTIVSAPGYVEESYSWLGGGIDKTVTTGSWSFTNDPTNGGAIRLLHSAGAFRFNLNSGGALGSGDVVYPTRVELVIDRNLAMDFNQGTDPSEPLPDGFATISLSLTFPSMTAGLLSLFRDNYDAGNALKGDMVYTHGTLLGSTEYRHRAYYLPKLKIVECPTEIPGAGRLPFTVRMTAHKAASVPTGFPSGYDEELTEEWQNEISGDPLA